MTRLIVTLVAASATAFAQDQIAAPKPAVVKSDIVKVIQIRQADVESLAQIIKSVTGGLAVVTADPARRVLIVRGTPEGTAVVEAAVKALDEPPAPKPSPPNVELTVHLLYGAAEEKADSVPQDLASTVKQLRGLFPYKSYRVLAAARIRGRTGACRTASTLACSATGRRCFPDHRRARCAWTTSPCSCACTG
jgi:hypothetical protein